MAKTKLTINNEKTYELTKGKSLFHNLIDKNIYLPSACGGRGMCGRCRIKIFSDTSTYTESENRHLSETEKTNGYRLACQVVVDKDLSVEIPENILNWEYNAVIDQIENVTPDIKSIKLSFDKPLTFRAGQYIQLNIPPYDNIKEKTIRSYSLASPPSNKNKIELLVRLVPDGIATTYIHHYLKKGDSISFTGPFGDFYIRDTNTGIIFVAGGSGLAPIKSMVLNMQEKNKMNRDMYFFFGARTVEDIYYDELFKKIEENHSSFHYIPALSEPEKSTEWDGKEGLITDVLERFLSNEKGKEWEAYLCGSPGMIKACVQNILLKNNIKSDRIYYDKFA
ncbi:MAG: NADH:ubiquinone reductase (Na(+)-transporting) subunit F [Petrotogales bacterium]